MEKNLQLRSCEHCRPLEKLLMDSNMFSFLYRDMLRRRAKEKNLTLIFDEAHTLFSSEFMWTPPLPFTPELKTQLEDSGIKLDQKSIEFFAIWKKLNYRALEFHSSCTGEGKPDCAVQIEKETFVLEGVMHVRGQGQINQHLQRFNNMVNYKNAKHQGLYIIGNDSDKMLKTLKNTKAGKVQLIGLVPNIAHTAYTVHVKSEGIEGINTCNVDCDLVARRLVLKDDGKPELHSVQSLKSINLSPKAETSQPAKTEMVWVRELKEENGEYKLVGNALPTEPVPKNIGFLKEVIKEKAQLQPPAHTLTVYHLTEGTWQEEEPDAQVTGGRTKDKAYGYLVP
ncbi:unnamed protein product [Effrenium voratum]|uniref:Uncharacterized protein n=1 Tax=Effrenium voratum TaxID=2562239 RepID=A0AA36MLC3_9DINO|nr:unnamed protein product [Effrenium voratum]